MLFFNQMVSVVLLFFERVFLLFFTFILFVFLLDLFFILPPGFVIGSGGGGEKLIGEVGREVGLGGGYKLSFPEG